MVLGYELKKKNYFGFSGEWYAIFGTLYVINGAPLTHKICTMKCNIIAN
jgi:hypothetical protein